MAPEYGATCGFFPVDEITLGYLRLSGRPESTVKLVEAYSKEQGLWREKGHEPVFTDTPAPGHGRSRGQSGRTEAPAGPRGSCRTSPAPSTSSSACNCILQHRRRPPAQRGRRRHRGRRQRAFGEIDYQHDGQTHRLKNGAVVIAAITSCTNTSNPSVMMAAGLLAKKAVEKGLQRKPWVKSSLAPGSKVVTDYFKAAGLTRYLDELGFDLVGYGCTTCIG